MFHYPVARKEFLGAILAVLVALFAAAFASARGAAETSVAIGQPAGTGHSSALSLNITGSAEADEIGITLDPGQTQYVITSTHQINSAPPCTSTSPYEVQCPASEIASFSATLLEGNDTLRMGPSVKAPASVTGGDGLDDVIGGSGSETLAGGKASDRLVGNKGQDTLKGGKGADTLNGGKGRDLLKGGKGVDVLRGGPGRDIEQQ